MVLKVLTGAGEDIHGNALKRNWYLSSALKNDHDLPGWGVDKGCRTVLSWKRLRASEACFRNWKKVRAAGRLRLRRLRMLWKETWVVGSGRSGGPSRLQRILEVVQLFHFYRWGSWVPKRQKWHILYVLILNIYWNFPGGPVVRTLHFHCKGHGFNPWSGN